MLLNKESKLVLQFLFFSSFIFDCLIVCYILTFDPAVNREIGASSRRYQDITLTVDRLNSVQMWRSQDAGGCQTIILPGATESWVSWSQLQLKFEAVRTSSQQRPWALRSPGWAAQQNKKEVLLKTEELGGQYVAVYPVSNSPLTHKPFATLSQTFRIKCERYIFLKNCVCASLLLILFLHVYVYV